MFKLTALMAAAVLFLPAQQVDSLFYGNSKKLTRNPFGWGYVAGANSYGDIGKYQRFDIHQPVHIVGAKFWMGMKRIVNTPDSITVVFKKNGYGKEYYDSLSGGPGTTIASVTTRLDQFDTTGAGTSFMLLTPVNVSGGTLTPESLFVGIEWSAAANDTFSLYIDSAGQGQKANRAWEKVTGFSYDYQRFNEPNDFSWLMDVDLWIALLYKQGLLAVRDERASIPEQFALEQNYPNPFNPATTIGFSIRTSGAVSLKVFDILGKEIATLVNGHLDAGRYTATFSAPSLPSGVYFYCLQSATSAEIKKMILIK